MTRDPTSSRAAQAMSRVLSNSEMADELESGNQRGVIRTCSGLATDEQAERGRERGKQKWGGEDGEMMLKEEENRKDEPRMNEKVRQV